MPPRRNNHHGHGHGHGHLSEVQGLTAGIDPETIENQNPDGIVCCVPTECLCDKAPIPAAQVGQLAIKVACNNDHCNQSRFMHRECFEAWEQTVLTYLRSCGRARSWSEKQRLQNLWTKKGYDLAFKACGCNCGRGHLRKDLDWIPPKPTVAADNQQEAKKKRRKHKSNTKPVLAVSTPQHHAHHPNSQQQQQRSDIQVISATQPADKSSSSVARNRANSISSSGSSSGSSPSPDSPTSPTDNFSGSNTGVKKKSKFDFFSDRSRHGSGPNSIFSRRLDFSSFNALPRHKLNSYHIKMEDEGNHGNDDTRCFILSTLAGSKQNRAVCVLCHSSMSIFDRYPLIDGTFFLSPRQHIKGCCIEVKADGRTQYLSAVCMACLEGWNVRLSCRFCHTTWDGSSLVLGTMYSYDIFAAIPCCIERLKCNGCAQLVVPPEHRLPFFSEYSRPAVCPHCRLLDFHFVKPLVSFYRQEQGQHSPKWS